MTKGNRGPGGGCAGSGNAQRPKCCWKTNRRMSRGRHRISPGKLLRDTGARSGCGGSKGEGGGDSGEESDIDKDKDKSKGKGKGKGGDESGLDESEDGDQGDDTRGNDDGGDDDSECVLLRCGVCDAVGESGHKCHHGEECNEDTGGWFREPL